MSLTFCFVKDIHNCTITGFFCWYLVVASIQRHLWQNAHSNIKLLLKWLLKRKNNNLKRWLMKQQNWFHCFVGKNCCNITGIMMIYQQWSKLVTIKTTAAFALFYKVYKYSHSPYFNSSITQHTYIRLRIKNQFYSDMASSKLRLTVMAILLALSLAQMSQLDLQKKMCYFRCMQTLQYRLLQLNSYYSATTIDGCCKLQCGITTWYKQTKQYDNECFPMYEGSATTKASYWITEISMLGEILFGC